MDQQKIDQMRVTLNKLEDIKNSQESIINKINHVITDLFEHPDKAMENAHQKSSDNVDAVRDAMEEYEMKLNKLENQE